MRHSLRGGGVRVISSENKPLSMKRDGWLVSGKEEHGLLAGVFVGAF